MRPKDELPDPSPDDHETDLEKNIADEGETAGPLGRLIGTFDTDNVGADLGTGGVGGRSKDDDQTRDSD
jgi:hypothetical protein